MTGKARVTLSRKDARYQRPLLLAVLAYWVDAAPFSKRTVPSRDKRGEVSSEIGKGVEFTWDPESYKSNAMAVAVIQNVMEGVEAFFAAREAFIDAVC